MCGLALIKQVTKGMAVHITERILSIFLPESKQTVHHISLKDRICKWPRENNSGKRVKGMQSVEEKNEKFEGGRGNNFYVTQWKFC